MNAVSGSSPSHPPLGLDKMREDARQACNNPACTVGVNIVEDASQACNNPACVVAANKLPSRSEIAIQCDAVTLEERCLIPKTHALSKPVGSIDDRARIANIPAVLEVLSPMINALGTIETGHILATFEGPPGSPPKEDVIETVAKYFSCTPKAIHESVRFDEKGRAIISPVRSPCFDALTKFNTAVRVLADTGAEFSFVTEQALCKLQGQDDPTNVKM